MRVHAITSLSLAIVANVAGILMVAAGNRGGVLLLIFGGLLLCAGLGWLYILVQMHRGSRRSTNE